MENIMGGKVITGFKTIWKSTENYIEPLQRNGFRVYKDIV